MVEPKKPKVKANIEEEGEEETPKETGYVECKSCSFRFLRSYQKVHRLCFPVVGVRASGKTHMLATGYDRVRKRTRTCRGGPCSRPRRSATHGSNTTST